MGMTATPLGNPLALGRTAEVYAWEEGWVLKLFRDWAPASWVDYEAEIARSVHASGLPVPAVGEIIEVQGRRGILYERVTGPSLFKTIQEKPWTVLEAARQLAELHAAMHECEATGLPPQRARLIAKIQNAGPLPERLKQAALGALQDLPDGERLCHGDFHPDNVLMTAKGPVIIDWPDASCGPPLADVARTSLLASASALPAETRLRRLIELSRRWFHRVYLRRYFELRPDGREQLGAWLPVIYAARLSEDIPEEREGMLARVRAAFSHS